MKKIINLLVGSEENNQRVDVFINKKESSLSRTRIKNLILNKKLKLNTKILISPAKKVLTGDSLMLEIPVPKIASLKPYKFKLNLIYLAAGISLFYYSFSQARKKGSLINIGE